MTDVLRFWGGKNVSDLAGSGHGFERTGNYLGCASTLSFVSGFRFEEFGVRENDAKLVVQAVEEQTQPRRRVDRSLLFHADEHS
jgi:hypothetical protein